MPLGIYCRVSTPAQESNTSFASQQRQGAEFAQLTNEPNFTIYKDVYTGTKAAGRTDWLRLIKDVEQGKIDKVLYFSLDRLARDTIEGLQFLDRLAAKNVKLFKFGSGEINYTDADVRVLLTVEFSFAEREAKKIKERTGKGKKESIDAGNHRYRALYGYRRADEFDKETGKRIWVKNDDEVKAVLYIFKCVIEEKMTLSKICKKLNELGYKPMESESWNLSSISSIIKQPAYSGKMYNTKKELIDGHSYDKIMEYDYWKQAQDLYEPCITSKINNGYSVKHPAVNIIKCKHCGSAYMINESKQVYKYKTKNEVRETIRIHYCHDTKKKCTQKPKYLNYDLINWIVEDVFVKALSDSADSLLDDMLSKIENAQSDKRDDIDRLKGLIEVAEKEVKNFNAAIAKGLDLDSAISEINSRKAKIVSYQATIDSLEKDIEQATKNYKTIKAEFSISKMVDYLKANNRQKRDMVKKLLSKATIDGDRIDFTLIDGREYTYNYKVMNQNKAAFTGINPDIHTLLIALMDSDSGVELNDEAQSLFKHLAKKKYK